MSIKILLADDHTIMRQGLRSLLEKEADFTVVAEAANGREVLEQARRVKPSVAIMDVTMPGLNGIEATRKLQAELPEVKVVALTVHADKNYLTGMLSAGCSGYLLKDCASDELVHAVRTVASGRAYISPEIAPLLLDDYRKRGAADTTSGAVELAPKEKEVLQLIAEGAPTKEIALRMGVSVKTIERTRAQIMEKLQFFSVAELTKYAVRHGITSLQ